MADRKYTRSKPKKYLVLENEGVLNRDTKKFFTHQRKIEKHLKYIIMGIGGGRNENHAAVASQIKFGFTDALVIVPTLYLSSSITRIAHDIAHSLRRKDDGDERYRFKEVYIIDTIQNLRRGMMYAGRDAIASMAGIINHVTSYILDENDQPRLFTDKEFFAMVRQSLYGDNDVRYEARYYLNKIEDADNPFIKIAKPDLQILFVDLPSGQLLASYDAANHYDLLTKHETPKEGKKYSAGYVDIYHGSKRLIFRGFEKENHELFIPPWRIYDIAVKMDEQIQIHYQDYQIRYA